MCSPEFTCRFEESSALALAVAKRMLQNGYQTRTFEKILAIAVHGSSSTTLDLVAMHLTDITGEQARELIFALGGKYANITDKNKNPDFPETPANEKILSTLKNKGI